MTLRLEELSERIPNTSVDQSDVRAALVARVPGQVPADDAKLDTAEVIGAVHERVRR
jgi:hypothetical protein